MSLAFQQVSIFLESRIIDLIEGRKNAPLLQFFLGLFAMGYKLVVQARNLAYDLGVFSVQSPSCPVASVGNIVAGGTGKTPFVHLLAKELADIGKVAILSRPYRAKTKNDVLQVSDGEQLLIDTADFGDEAYMLAKKNPHASVFSGVNRLRLCEMAAQKGSRLAILDDGFHVRKLKKNMDIVLISGKDPFGKRRFLPSGYLREDPNRLRAASYLVVTGIEELEEFENVKHALHMLSNAPVIGMKTLPEGVFNSEGKIAKDFKGKKIAAYCGIAKPDAFYQLLKQMGAEIICRQTAMDHAPLSRKQLLAFLEESKEKNAEYICFTEKDWVKVEKFQIETYPLCYVPILMKNSFGKNNYKTLLKELKELATS